jgi:hypothetical protein
MKPKDVKPDAAKPVESDEPFATFVEWRGEADGKAYAKLHAAPIARSSRWMSSSRPR